MSKGHSKKLFLIDFKLFQKKSLTDFKQGFILALSQADNTWQAPTYSRYQGLQPSVPWIEKSGVNAPTSTPPGLYKNKAVHSLYSIPFLVKSPHNF